MALTVEQLQERTRFIGSSDAPVIIGAGRQRQDGTPYQTLTDLWLAKTGRVEITQTTHDAADLGDRLEPLLCEWVSDRLGVDVVRGEHRASPDGILRAQLDGYIPELNETVEAKSSGLYSPMFRADEAGWGADGTDHVPFWVICQAQFALMLTKAARCHVPALLGGGVGLRHYVIDAMPDLQAEIERRCRAFWTDHVLTDIQPAEPASIDTLKVLKREPGKAVAVPDDLVDRYETAQAAAAEANEAREVVKRDILAALGDAEVGMTPIGTFTYYANARGVRTLRLASGGTK